MPISQWKHKREMLKTRYDETKRMNQTFINKDKVLKLDSCISNEKTMKPDINDTTQINFSMMYEVYYLMV